METVNTNQVPKAVKYICNICQKTAIMTFIIATPLFITSVISVNDQTISVIQNSKTSHNNDISLILIAASFIFIAIATLINGIILFIALIIALSSKGYSKKVVRSMAYMLINIPITATYQILILKLW